MTPDGYHVEGLAAGRLERVYDPAGPEARLETVAGSSLFCEMTA